MKRTAPNWDYPCIRREYEIKVEHAERWRGLPLHTQGVLFRPAAELVIGGITPAYAGSTSSGNTLRRTRKDYPCIRREYGKRGFWTLSRRGLPLHTQGVQDSTLLPGPPAGITPAYAGSTAGRLRSNSLPGDYPCIRREYRLQHNGGVYALGLPLHTQGVPIKEIKSMKFLRITPAYAGSTE